MKHVCKEGSKYAPVCQREVKQGGKHECEVKQGYARERHITHHTSHLTGQEYDEVSRQLNEANAQVEDGKRETAACQKALVALENKHYKCQEEKQAERDLFHSRSAPSPSPSSFSSSSSSSSRPPALLVLDEQCVTGGGDCNVS